MERNVDGSDQTRMQDLRMRRGNIGSVKSNSCRPQGWPKRSVRRMQSSLLFFSLLYPVFLHLILNDTTKHQLIA